MKRRHLDSAIFGDPEHDRSPGQDQNDATEAAPAQLRSERRLAKRRSVQGRRRLVVMTLTLGLVAGGGFVAYNALAPVVSSLTASKDYTGNGSGTVSVTVHNGDSGRSIGASLEKAGVVKTAKAFSDAAAADPRGGSIQPGDYTLRSKMSATSALAMLLDPANRTIPRVTIREGLWTSEVIKALSAATGQPLGDYQKALKDPTELGLPAGAKGDAEGYLFPATYEFDKSTTAAKQLHTMVAKSLEELGKLGVTSVNMKRVLTVASIIEAEAGRAVDRPKVARVIENRLSRPMPLQLDTTVAFIAGRRGKVTTTDAERASRSPYNTYLFAGLPPGPIDSPGLSAMEAALHPAPGPWLYFVAVNPETGETRFAVDAAGHGANVRLFQRWCSDHPGKC
ncbi:MAG: endolytic transglycosylase MltG [Dermatophilaceae bacterium]